MYLTINGIDSIIEQINGNKCLNIIDTDRNTEILKKYNQVFDGVKYHIKKIDNSNGKYDKNFMKIKFKTDDDISSKKQLYFPTITIIIRFLFKKDSIYYPQVYLDECLY